MSNKPEITDLFDFTKTDKKSYTKILHSVLVDNTPARGTRNRTISHRPRGRVVLLDPIVALKNSYSKTDVTKEAIRHPQFTPDSFPVKWALPYIDTLAKVGFGRGRLLLCHKWGIKRVPVLIVARSQADIDKWLKGKKPVETKPVSRNTVKKTKKAVKRGKRKQDKNKRKTD